MQKLVWKNSLGDEIDLTSGNYGITQWEGFSNASLNIQSQQVPFQDGGVYLDALIEQRELSVTLKMQDNGNLEERYRMRRELIHILNPKLGEGYLIYTNDFISKRIKCVAQVPLFETHNSDTRGTPKASLSWTACEPYWEDTEETFVSFTVKEHPHIINNGDVPTSVEIDLFSNDMKNPMIKNMTDDKYIKVLGEFNNSIKINTKLGNKTVLEEKEIGEAFTTGGNLNDIIYVKSKNLFLSVGKYGQILKSYNMTDWYLLRQNNIEYTKVIYVDYLDLFIAIGDLGKYSISTDLETWVDKQILNISLRLNDIICANNKIIVVANNGYIYTSTDSETWTYRPVVNADINAIVYAEDKNLYVAVADNTSSGAVIITSSDAENWSQIYLSSISLNLTAITYSEDLSLFVIGTNTTSHIITSSDGVTWTDLGAKTGSMMTDIIYSNKLRLFVGAIYDGAVIYSDDGENWFGLQIIQNKPLNGITYSDEYGYFFMAGNGGGIYITDLVEETRRIRGGVVENINSITYNPQTKYYYVVCTTEAIYKSKDKKNWGLVARFSSGSYAFNSIIYCEKYNKLIAVGTRGDIYESSDGDNWNKITSGVSASVVLRKIVYCDFLDKFFITTNTNTILISSDGGETWVSESLETNSRMLIDVMIRIDTNTIFFISDRGILVTTTDGVNFIYENTNVSKPKGICYSTWLETYFMSAYDDSNGTYLYSSFDCINWKRIKYFEHQDIGTLLTNELKKTIYMGGLDHTDNSCFVLNSIDGKIWDKKLLDLYNFNIYDLYKDEIDESLLAVGYLGLVYQFSYEINQNIINKLSETSDMGLKLLVGDNQLMSNLDSGDFICQIKYRQKYIGV